MGNSWKNLKSSHFCYRQQFTKKITKYDDTVIVLVILIPDF